MNLRPDAPPPKSKSPAGPYPKKLYPKGPPKAKPKPAPKPKQVAGPYPKKLYPKGPPAPRRQPLPKAPVNVGAELSKIAGALSAQAGDEEGVRKARKALSDARAHPAHYLLKTPHYVLNPNADQAGAHVQRAGTDIHVPSLSGVARVIKNDVAATGAAFYHDPLKQAGFVAKGIGKAIKASPALVEIPAAATYEGIRYGTGSKKGTRTLRKAGAAIAKDFSRRSGASYRGEPGALKKQIARQRKEGSFAELTDVATAALPAAKGLTVATKTAARSAKVAGKTNTLAQRAARATKVRPPSVEGAAKVGRAPRKSVPGAVAGSAQDVVRRKVQARAVRKASPEKPLPGRRGLAGRDDIVPLSARRADRRARLRVAGIENMRRHREQIDVARETRGAKGSHEHPERGTVRANYTRLTPEQRVAVKYAVEEGVRDSRSGAAAMSARAKAIEAHIEEKGGLTPAEKALDTGQLSEIKALANDPRVFDDPAVHAVADQEVARGNRIGSAAHGVDPQRHEAAVLEKQAFSLGVPERRAAETVDEYTGRLSHELGVHRQPHESTKAYRGRVQRRLDEVRGGERAPSIRRRPNESVSAYTQRMADTLDIHPGRGEAPASYRARLTKAVRARSTRVPEPRRPAETHAEWADRVRAAAAKSGRVEPGYYPSRHEDVEAARVVGGASTSAQPLRQRSGDLMRAGLERNDSRLLEKSHEALLRNSARVNAESDFLKTEGVRYNDEAAARADMAAKHVDENTIEYRKPTTGVVRSDIAPPSGPAQGDFAPTDSVWVVPKAAAKEFDAQRAARPAVLRKAGRVMRASQAAILGASIKWEAFQVLADSATHAAAGGLQRLIQNNRAYRELGDEGRDIVDIAAGTGAAHDLLDPIEGGRLSRFGEFMDHNEAFQRFLNSPNPLVSALRQIRPTILLRADAARTSAFRRSALIDKLVRDDRIANMDASLGALRKPIAAITKAMAKPDKERLDWLLQNQDKVEAAARHVNDIMGDWGTMTAAERNVLKPLITFYGYVRYSTRLLFHTLPVGHPLAFNMLLQAGHVGGLDPDLLPIDLASANPMMNLFTTMDKPSQVIGTLPPAAVIALNNLYGQSAYTGKGYTVEGGAAPVSSEDQSIKQHLRIGLNETLKLLAPVRILEHAQGVSTSDTLPWSRKPMVITNPTKQADIEDQQDLYKQSKLSRAVHEALGPFAGPDKAGTAARRSAEQGAKRAAAARKKARDKAAAKRKALKEDYQTQLDFAQAVMDAKMNKAMGYTSAPPGVSDTPPGVAP